MTFDDYWDEWYYGELNTCLNKETTAKTAWNAAKQDIIQQIEQKDTGDEFVICIDKYTWEKIKEFAS